MLTQTPSDVMQIDEVEHEVKSKPSTSTPEETISLEKIFMSILEAFGNKHITVLIEDTTCNQALPMVHTEWNFTHEAVPLHTERLQKSYSTQNESVLTIEQISIVEHEYQLDETSWFDKKAPTTTSTSMPHETT